MKHGKIFLFSTFFVFLICGLQAQESQTPWRPRIIELAYQYSQVRHYAKGEKQRMLTVLALFERYIEKEPIKHAEKFYGYYAYLLYLAGKYDQALEWAKKAEATPYKFAEKGEPRNVRLDVAFKKKDNAETERQIKEYYDEIMPYPAASDHLSLEEKLNKLVRQKAWGEKLAAENRTSKVFHPKMPGPRDISRLLDYDKLVEIGDLYLQMGDRQRALHAYTQAFMSYPPNSMVKYATIHPHPILEKIACVYEKFGNWDQALFIRLSQLCHVSRNALENTPTIVENMERRIVELLARIGAEEKVVTPQLQYNLKALNRILDLYMEQCLPNLGEKVIELMEIASGEQQAEARARLLELKAHTLSQFTADPEGYFRVVFWGEFWTQDKIVAVHQQAIEWGRKAKWPEDRIKKLQAEIETFPDLFKYIKEPKNLQDLLEGKATEPKW